MSFMTALDGDSRAGQAPDVSRIQWPPAIARE